MTSLLWSSFTSFRWYLNIHSTVVLESEVMSEDVDVVDSENISDLDLEHDSDLEHVSDLELEHVSDLEMEHVSDLELSGDVDMVYSWLVRNIAVIFSFGNMSDTSFAVGDIVL